MFVAKHDDLDHIVTGVDVQQRLTANESTPFDPSFSCPLCGKPAKFNPSSVSYPFDYFRHVDGDCISTNSVSDEHRLATEVTIKHLYNRVREVTGEPVVINVEKWIGDPSEFVIADIRVPSPLKIASEVFFKSNPLALGRRLNTMFANDYQTYLVFHMGGPHDVNRIERYIQRIAPLKVGRFDRDQVDVTLGDLFTEAKLDLTRAKRDLLPNYIMR